MCPLLGLALSLLALPCAFGDDTVADDIGTHMMARISELLSPEECQAFHLKLLGPEENVKDELERLSEKNNLIGGGRRRRKRRRRDNIIITTSAQCEESLQQWLETEGDTMYWDRLSRALQLIGRADVSLELGKNLNQDKNLEIKKNVEEYHETVKHLTSSLLLDEGPERSAQGRQRRHGRGSAQTQTQTPPEQGEWDGLELIVERKALPPYNRSLFEWATPLATGVVGGFVTSFILVALALYSFVWILHEGSAGSAPLPGDRFSALILRPPPTSRGGIYYSFQHLESYDGEAPDDADEAEET
ncbi:transmembrane and death domain protein 1 [Ahaetulla prasina]|uniref:transmembrane and death domain protein 1 n=1 Tax=Ahaetulla prasina TaxID=499056 RepID=UPI00264900F4|nr:transmembrane and death domain protein 1 [Ahaetulla prasina]